MPKNIRSRLLPVLIASTLSGGAYASGFQLLEQNASGLGNAYAGSAAIADNASTIYFNPAGMTQLKEREVSIGGAFIHTSYKFTNNGSKTGTLTGNGGDAGGSALVPNAYMSMALNKDWYVGLGIGAPFGLKTEYDSPWVGAAQSVKFDIKTINVNPSVAWRASDNVSLGFGVNWTKFDAEYARIAGTSAGYNATKVKLNVKDDAWGWNVGALFKVSPSTKIGVSYRSEVKLDLTGDMKFNGTLAQRAGLTTDRSAYGTLKLPDTWLISATHALDDNIELLGDISRTGWSSIDKLDIINGESKGSGATGAVAGKAAQTLHTDFRDTWRFAVGANYRYNDAWKLKVGLAYDQAPVKGAESRLVSLPDNDRTWLSVGAQWKPSKDSTLDLGAAYLLIKNPDINNNQSADSRGTVTGSYKGNILILGAQYSVAF